MSRRFGRNQRRRAREEIAGLQQGMQQVYSQFSSASARLRKADDDLAQMREWLHEVHSRVGRYAIAAGVGNFEADWLKRGKSSFQMHTPDEFPTTTCYGAAAMDIAYTVQKVVMQLLEVEAIRRPLQCDMHCRVTFDDINIGYAMSDHALHSLTEDEIRRRIAPEIARLLVSEIKKAGRR